MTWTMPWCPLSMSEQPDAVLAAVPLERRQHVLRHHVEERPALIERRHDVIDGAEGALRHRDAQPAGAQHVERLRRRDLVDQMQADEQLRLAARERPDGVRAPRPSSGVWPPWGKRDRSTADDRGSYGDPGCSAGLQALSATSCAIDRGSAGLTDRGAGETLPRPRLTATVGDSRVTPSFRHRWFGCSGSAAPPSERSCLHLVLLAVFSPGLGPATLYCPG